MKRNTICLFSGLTIILCLMVAFALTVAAQTGLSEDQVKIGETVNVSLDVPTGAWVTAWSCTPYGALSFSATTNTGTTYKTVATAVKPGEITVRATVKYADNTTSTVTVGTLLTVLEDGIYTVGNDYADDYYSQSGAFYLRSQITYPTSGGLFVAQHSQNNFGDITNRIYNYWYIEHQGSGQYTIRSVADENKALTYSGSTFSLSTIGSNVTTAAKWYIRGENIIPVSATTKCLILSSAAPEGTYHTDGNAYTYFNLHVNGIGGIAIENWSFEKENISGVIFKKNNSEEFKTTFTKSYHIDTDTVDFSELGYSIKTYHQSGPSATTITWSSSKTSVATVNSSTGKLTIRGTGRTTITVNANFASDSLNKTASCVLDVYLLEDGTYFLNNSQTNMHAGPQNGTISNGVKITQQVVDRNNVAQKWRFTHIGENIYVINPTTSSSYYIGVKNDSITNGEEIVLRSGNVTSGMKWKIEAGQSGYKIISCLNSSLVLGTYSNSATNGEKLVLCTYTNDSNYKDEWDYYDFSLVNYYDVSFTGDNAYLQEYISDANDFVSKVFYEQFGVKIRMVGEATINTDAIDDYECTGVNNSCEIINCGLVCNDHHKNIGRIATYFYTLPRKNSHISVFWTNRDAYTYCQYKNMAHTNIDEEVIAVQTNDYPVIHFLNLKTSERNTQKIVMSIVLAHEIAHVLGLPDQYTIEGHDIPNSMTCVMNKVDFRYLNIFYDSIIDEESDEDVFAFCDSCQSKLQDLIRYKTIQGN